MKKPILKNFSDEVLILLSSQKDDKEFDQEVRSVLFDRYAKRPVPYFKIYFKYMHSTGVEHLVYGDLLASRLIEGGYRVDEEVLDELLPNLSIEHIWALGKSENDLIREKSREVLFRILDLYDQEVITIKDENTKVLRKENIICFKRKGE